MRIPHEDFVPAGMKLLLGQQQRINHLNCPAGADSRQRLYIKRQGGKLLAYCHNCGGWGVRGINRRDVKAIDELLVEHESAQRNGHGELVLPEDKQMDPDTWPGEAANWVYKYGITRDEIIDHELCYSSAWNRVILPVYENGKLVFWQGRAVNEWQDPKYISAKSHAKAMFFAHANLASGRNKCIITEDILSAIKVSRWCDSIALLGTSPDFDGLRDRLENYKRVGIFLDPDHAGHTKSIELEKRLDLVFRGRVSRIYSHVYQPKEMDNSALAAIVDGL